MKKLILASALLAATGVSHAEFGLSGGFVTDYVFRGSTLGDAGAYGSVEYSKAGFTVGVWAIDDGDGSADNEGLEYDVYASYGFEATEDLSFSIGLTQYNYTYTASEEFEREVNLGAAYGPVALDVAIGTDVNGPSSDAEFDYTYVSLSGQISNIGLLVGSYDADSDNLTGATDRTTEQSADYIHYEVSTGAELEAIDASLALVVGFKDNGPAEVADSEYIYLDLSKSFDF